MCAPSCHVQELELGIYRRAVQNVGANTDNVMAAYSALAENVLQRLGYDRSTKPQEVR